MKTRRIGRAIGSVAIALLLAGCFKVNMNLDVAADNTVSGTAVIAVDESLLPSGQGVDDLFADLDLSDLPDDATVGPYDEDGFVGQQVTFNSVPLAEFAGSGALSATGDDLSIVREGDEFHVTGGLDMSGEGIAGTEVPQEFLENVEFTIAITFPGEVVSATGDIDGNTVTWRPTVGQNTPMEAVASAIPSSSSPILMIVLIALGALVLGAVVFFLTHRTPAPTTNATSGWETSSGPTIPTEGPVTQWSGETPSATPSSTDTASGSATPPPPPPPPSEP